MRACLLAACLLGCAPTDSVMETLDAEGYVDVELGGFDPFVCSDSERYSRRFSAVRDGRVVEGIVCCTGLFFGGCTVRH